MSDYLIEDILPKREFSVLAGDSMVGKTRLVFQMLACAQRGEGFFGHHVRGGLRLGYVLVNMPLESAKKAARAIGLDIDRLKICSVMDDNLKMPNASVLVPHYLRPLATCDLVVVDRITDFLGQMPSMAKSLPVAHWCHKSNTAVLGLHHPPKWKGNKPITHPSDRLSLGLKRPCASRMSLAPPGLCDQQWSEFTVDIDGNRLLRINLDFNDAGRLVEVEDREACLETQ